MLVIRLSRTGRAKYATYRVVVANSRRAATGKIVTSLGFYNPHTKEVQINKEDAAKYLASGAQPSSRVIKLLQAQKVEIPAWALKNLKVRNRKPKKEVEEAPAESPDTADAESAEAPEATEKPADDAAASEEVASSDESDAVTESAEA